MPMTLTEKLKGTLTAGTDGWGAVLEPTDPNGESLQQTPEWRNGLESWFTVYGIAVGIARGEEPFESIESVVERALAARSGRLPGVLGLVEGHPEQHPRERGRGMTGMTSAERELYERTVADCYEVATTMADDDGLRPVCLAVAQLLARRLPAPPAAVPDQEGAETRLRSRKRVRAPKLELVRDSA